MLISDGAAAPVSLGDSTPGLVAGTFYPSTGVALSDRFSTYGEIYKRQLWVSVLVNKVAGAAARLPLKVYRRREDGREEARDTPYARLLRYPNRRHDPQFFWVWTVSTFEVYGEAMWVKVRARASGPPVELWPLHPANVSTERDERGNLLYVLRTPSGELKIAERDIVHFKTYNPDSLLRGLSRLEPLRQTLVNEDAARRATTGFWNNAMRPATVLKHPGNLSQPAADRLALQVRNTHVGPENYGKTLILEEGMEPHQLSLTAEEAQYFETRRLNREEACAIYDVPPPVVHILDRATFSNITEQMRSMYRDTMAPRLGMYESVLQAQLADEFGDSDLYAEFLMDEVLRGAFEARAEAWQKADFYTMAEKRAAENLPYIPGTEHIFVNTASMPLETLLAIEPPTAPSAPIAEATVRSVMGRIGRARTLADVDPVALLSGLNGDTATVLSLYGQTIDAGDDIAGFRARLKEAR